MDAEQGLLMYLSHTKCLRYEEMNNSDFDYDVLMRLAGFTGPAWSVCPVRALF